MDSSSLHSQAQQKTAARRLGGQHPKITPMRSLIVDSLFWIYQGFFKPFLLALGSGPVGCRYPESCSHYARRIYLEENFLRATILSTKRVLGCHPWHRSLGQDNEGLSK